MMCSLLTFIKQCETIFFMLSTGELELRCLMNWKDFKCSWIIKSSERRRGEQSGRCARLTDQEALPVLSVRRDLPESPPQRYKLGAGSHRFHSQPSTVPRKSTAPQQWLIQLNQREGLCACFMMLSSRTSANV